MKSVTPDLLGNVKDPAVAFARFDAACAKAVTRRAAYNATRHGLSGRIVVLPNEDRAAYEAFSKEIVGSLDPQTPFERELAQTIADQQWRLNRIHSIEDSMLALGEFRGVPDPDATGDAQLDTAIAVAREFRNHSQDFVNLSIYEQRIHRIQKEALRQLQELQAARRAREQTELEQAVKLQKMHAMQDLPYEPAADGFVYASARIERERLRRDRLEAAEIASRVGYNLAEFRAEIEKLPLNLAATARHALRAAS